MFLKYQVALQTFATSVATDMVRRAQEAREDERGQTFVEWLGVMALIVAVVLLIKPQLGSVASAVIDLITSAITKLKEQFG
jgi:Flp pilus assembly pilin Flp